MGINLAVSMLQLAWHDHSIAGLPAAFQRRLDYGAFFSGTVMKDKLTGLAHQQHDGAGCRYLVVWCHAVRDACGSLPL